MFNFQLSSKIALVSWIEFDNLSAISLMKPNNDSNPEISNDHGDITVVSNLSFNINTHNFY